MSASPIILHRTTSCIVGIILLVLVLLFGVPAGATRVFQIDGYYLNATPEQLGVAIETDPLLEEKYYETEVNGVRLFFVRVDNRLHVYRIIKEISAPNSNIKSLLDNLKVRYGTPDKQQIKTSSIRSQNRLDYRTTVKNKAVWNISESHEFNVEVETERIVYELIDHNPEEIETPRDPTSLEDDEEFTVEGWDPDY